VNCGGLKKAVDSEATIHETRRLLSFEATVMLFEN
jgi:hypothetical protein